jgi:hypothetical protein
MRALKQHSTSFRNPVIFIYWRVQETVFFFEEMFKKLLFQGRVQEAADQIINLLMYCTFRHLLCALPGRLCIVAVGWSIRCWSRFRVQEGLQTPAAIIFCAVAVPPGSGPPPRQWRHRPPRGEIARRAVRGAPRPAGMGCVRARRWPASLVPKSCHAHRVMMAWWWMDGYGVRHRASAGEAAAHTSRCAEYARHRTSR